MTRGILIDYENVQPERFPGDQLLDCHILVFLGTQQKDKLTAALVAALQPFGDRVTYIPVSASAPNGLDSHIAFHLGSIATAHPDDRFHVVSADRGFDPLLDHMRNNLGIRVSRRKTLPPPAALPASVNAVASNDSTLRRARLALEHLPAHHRPETARALGAWLESQFPKLSAPRPRVLGCRVV